MGNQRENMRGFGQNFNDSFGQNPARQRPIYPTFSRGNMVEGLMPQPQMPQQPQRQMMPKRGTTPRPSPQPSAPATAMNNPFSPDLTSKRSGFGRY